MTEFEVFYNKEKKVIEAESLWDAKQKGILLFKVPKKYQGLLAIQSLKSKEKQEFQYS